MKTQIPRSSHQSDLRYSGVYEQMGRMIDAADWNELVEIVKRHFAESLEHAIASGTPRDHGTAISQAVANDPIEIKPGYVYADGVLGKVMPNDANADATTFGLDEQRDFPGVTLPADLAELKFYVDIWDRSVVAIQDGELLDPGLHGADTCSRTQTLAQVKWCEVGTNPEVDDFQQGTAECSVELRKKLAEPDPCDPCADEIDLDARIGNYLFRLEVHDVVGPPDEPESIVLKWSTENGAEQHSVDAVPEEFKTGSFVYEFFSETTERHLGFHHDDGIQPDRGQLEMEYPDVDPAGLPFVRRWDGYVKLLRNNANSWSVAKVDGKPDGRDRSQALLDTGDPSGTGFIVVGATVKINLDSLILELTLEDDAFLAGDYWVGSVRESIHDVGSTIFTDAPPSGVFHHYLYLGETNDTGELLDPANTDTDRWRMLHFPPLTDVQAFDVGYVTQCDSGLFDAEHDTVKKALDRLCELTAEHIGYTQDCNNGLFDENVETVKDALDRLCGLSAIHVEYKNEGCKNELFDATIETAQDAFDRLCDLEAKHVLYESDCPHFSNVKNVEEALEILCDNVGTGGGGGCKVTVGENGQFKTIQEAVSKNLDKEQLCICLLPVDKTPHVISSNLHVTKPMDLCIEGCGRGTKVVLTARFMLFESLNSVVIRGISLRMKIESVFGFRDCGTVFIEDCEIVGAALTPFLGISGGSSVSMHRCLVSANRDPLDDEAPDEPGLSAIQIMRGDEEEQIVTLIDNKIVGDLILYSGDAKFGDTEVRDKLVGLWKPITSPNQRGLHVSGRTGRLHASRNVFTRVALGSKTWETIKTSQPGGTISGVYKSALFTNNAFEVEGSMIVGEMVNFDSNTFPEDASGNDTVLSREVAFFGNHGSELASFSDDIRPGNPNDANFVGIFVNVF